MEIILKNIMFYGAFLMYGYMFYVIIFPPKQK